MGKNKTRKLKLTVWASYFLLFLLAASSPLEALGQQTSAESQQVDERTILVHIQADGSVVARESVVLTADEAGMETHFSLPYSEGALIDLRSVQVATRSGGEILDYVDLPSAAEAPENAEVYYTATRDLEKRVLDVQVRSSFVAEQERVLRMRYRLADALVKYRDIAVLELDFANLAAVVEEAPTIQLSFSGANQMPSEEPLPIRIFTNHNDAEAAPFELEAGLNTEALSYLNAETLPYELEAAQNVLLQSEDLREVTRTSVRIVFPARWLPDLPLSAANDVNMLQTVLDEEGVGQSQSARTLRVREVARGIYPYLLVLAAGILLYYLYRRNLEPWLRYRKVQLEIPEDLKPAEVNYIFSGVVGGRTIQATMKDLVARDYLDYKEREFRRRLEVELPDENALLLYERHLLHWVWEMMDGHEGLSAEAFHEEATQVQTRLRFAQQFRRFSRLLHDRLSDKKLTPQDGLLNIHRPLLLIGALYALAGALYMILPWMFWGGPILILIGLGFGFLAFRQSYLTTEGQAVRHRILHYRKQLTHYGQELEGTEATLQYFAKHFPYAVALGRENEFITSLADQVPFEEFMASSFMKSFGSARLERILESVEDRPGGLSEERVRKVYRHVAREIEKDGRAFIASILQVKLNKYRLGT